MRHPTQSKGLAGFIRRSTVLPPHAYVLERNGVRLASHDTIGALLRNVEDKGPGVRIVRTRDGVCVWPAEEVKGVEST